MIDTILFDLDGTVLPMDIDKFMKLYMYNLGVFFKDKIDPKLLAESIMKSTEVMVRDTSNKKNEDVFMDYFDTLVDGDIEEYKTMFLQFYETMFDNVQASTSKNEYMRKSVDLLKEKGYKIVLATNPLFPLVANHHRIQWAGFKPEEFEYISCFEQNTFCKPHIEYYQEVLYEIQKKPEQCMMIGNDVFDDLPVRKLGVQTYLIKEHLLNKYNQDYETDYEGTYEEFYKFVCGLDLIK